MKKILIILSLVMLVLFGGVFFVVKSKINSSEIRQIVLTKLQETFPKADVSLGEFDLSIGKSVTINAENLSIVYKKEYPLVRVKDIKLQVPIWAILFGSGQVDLIADAPEVGFYSIGKSHNWELAMKSENHSSSKSSKKEATQGKKENPSSSKAGLAIPSFISSSSVNISLFKLIFDYNLGDNKGKILVDKFLLKNLGLESHAGFEILTQINSELSKKEAISFSILSVGEFKLKDILEKQLVETTVSNQFSKFELKGMPYTVPNIKNEVKLKASFDGEIEAASKILFEKSSIRFLLTKNKSVLRVKNIEGKLLVSDLLAMVNELAIKVDPLKSELSVEGGLEVKNDQITPDLSFKLFPALKVTSLNQDFLVSLSGSQKAEKLALTSEVNGFEGVINTDLNAVTPLKPFSLKHYNADVRLSNIKIAKAWLDQFSESKDSTQQDPSPKSETGTPQNGSVATKDQKKTSAPMNLPHGLLKFEVANSSIEGLSLSSSNKIETAGNVVTIHPSKMTLGDGELLYHAKMKMDNEESKSDFDLKLKKLNIEVFNSFLPKKIKGSKGIFNGVVKGSSTTKKESLDYDVQVNVEGKEGSLEGINIKEYTEKISNIAGKLPFLKKSLSGKDEVDLDDAFDLLSLKGNFKTKHYRIEKFFFEGLKKKVTLETSGNLYPLPTSKEGVLEGYFMDTFGISKALKKNAGTEKLPIQLKGKGFSLSPSYDYTLKKLAKTAYKTKAKAKVEKAIDKNMEKIKTQGKEEVKKLLKGFFK